MVVVPVKLYPDAANIYIRESGSISPGPSEDTVRSVLRSCQATRPDYQLCDWTAPDLAAYCLSGTPAPLTVQSRKSKLRAFFDWVSHRGLVQENPSTSLKFLVSPGRNRVRHGNWLSDEQVDQLLNSYDVTDELEARNRMIMLIGLFTGLRRGELADLRWSSFTSDLSMMRVKGKGGKIRDLPIAEQLQEELLAWREQALGPAVLPTFRWIWRDGERVRTIDWDAPLGRNGLDDVMRKAEKQIGVPIRAHDLRRSFAGWLQSNGVPLDKARDLMRHESIQTTGDVYYDRNPLRLNDTMRGLRRAM